MFFFTFFLYTRCIDNAYTHSLIASPLSYHRTQMLSRTNHVFKLPPYLPRMVFCQFLLCVFLPFFSCVCSGILLLSPGTRTRANVVYNMHTHTLSLGTRARAVYNVHFLVSCLSLLLSAIHTSSHPSLGQQLTLAGTNYTASPKCPESRPLSRIFPPFQTPPHSLSHKVWLSKHNHHARWPQPQS